MMGRYAVGSEKVALAADWIASAERPVVIAGGGVHLSGAEAELAALADLANLPTGSTTMGKGVLDEEHPLALGPLTYATTRSARSTRAGRTN